MCQGDHGEAHSEEGGTCHFLSSTMADITMFAKLHQLLNVKCVLLMFIICITRYEKHLKVRYLHLQFSEIIFIINI